MSDLIHQLEPLWLSFRWATGVLIGWDLWDALRDLRFHQSLAATKPRALMLAKWRVAVDLFLGFLSAAGIASLTWVMLQDRHVSRDHVPIAIGNSVVLALCLLVVYFRLIRERVERDGPPR